MIFLVFGFLAYQGGTGGGAGLVPGVCDAGLRSAPPGAARRGTPRPPSATSSGRTPRRSSVWPRQKGAPPRAWLVALATAKQESDLRNIPYGDRDSLGLFQQRPSQGWGTPAQVLDPVYSTTIFLDRLLQVPSWDRLPVTVAAQTVQRSAFPDAYAKWEGLAADLVAQLAGCPDPAGCGPTARRCPRARRAPRSSSPSARSASPTCGAPPGPNTYDCSGLILRAFQAAGIDLPRVSRQQFTAGGHVPVKQAQPGDLLFYATDPSDPATIHHVMLYMGDGQMVEAPYSGESVRVRSVPWGYPELVPLATRPGPHPTAAPDRASSAGGV